MNSLHAFKTLSFQIHDSKGGGLRLHAPVTIQNKIENVVKQVLGNMQQRYSLTDRVHVRGAIQK